MSAGPSTDPIPGPSFVTASGHTLWGHNHATAPAHRKPDTLDKTVVFLAKRDGIDKVTFFRTDWLCLGLLVMLQSKQENVQSGGLKKIGGNNAVLAFV